MSEAVTPNQSMIIFTASLVHQLSSLKHRLEPTYVGIRRVRPSSREVKDAFKNSKANHEVESSRSSPLIFKVVGDDGVERRMTKQEKKALKFQIAQQKKQQKEQRRLERERNQPPPMKTGKKRKYNNDHSNEEEEENPQQQQQQQAEEKPSPKPPGEEDDDESIGAALAQVGVAPKKLTPLEQEIADLKGERQGVPPVMIPAALAQVAVQTPQFLPGNTFKVVPPNIWIDDDLAQEWSDVIKESMIPSLEVRAREDMRAMVYQILPEPWKRLRPDSIQSGQQPPIAVVEEQPPKADNDNDDDTRQSWEFVTVRDPALSAFDSDMAIVAEVLLRHTTLHVSCGAKFGSDFLVYDGPRCERHAFAGLRVLNETETTYAAPSQKTERTFPVPCSYGLAGYVRCLNTAAKLALIAMVKREKGPDGAEQCRVAFVDLKLERVDGSKRKDVSEKLAKLDRT